jgi:AbrB family looped-hinge helix DNA binding protein
MLKFKRYIGEKGQVVIPKDIRENLGLRKGSAIIFEVRDKEIVIKPLVKAEKWVEEFCASPKKLRKKINIKKIIEEEYDIP